jgi:uncharacterized protein (DUF58 family)
VSETHHSLIKIELASLITLASPAMRLKRQRPPKPGRLSGQFLSPHKGRGMVFEETRPYQAGDDVRHIDWRVTARTHQPHSKLFREERETPVMIAVDYRLSMQFATRGVFKSVQAARLAGLLAWSAWHEQERVGGQIMTENGYQILKPQAGRAALLHFLHALVSPKWHHAQQPLSLADQLIRLRRYAHPGTRIYMISDFRGFEAESERQICELSQHCELSLIQVFDPLEAHLPDRGDYRFTDGKTFKLIQSADSLTRQRYAQRFLNHQQHLQQLCRKYRISWQSVDTQQNPERIRLNL